VGTARSMLKAKNLPNWLWGEAVLAAVYVLNRVPTRSVEGATPFEVWYGKKLAVHHLHTFGCLAYVKNTKPNLSKLDDRGCMMIFTGYEQGTKAYRVYDPVMKKVHITRDVLFDEAGQWNWEQTEAGADQGSGNFSVEYLVLSSRCTGEYEEQIVVGTPAPSPVGVPGSPQSWGEQEDGEQFEVQSDLSEHLDADHDDAPLRLRSMDSIVGDAVVPGQAVRNLEQGQLFAVAAVEPATLAEAEQDDH
jgi:hypothetical protein